MQNQKKQPKPKGKAKGKNRPPQSEPAPYRVMGAAQIRRESYVGLTTKKQVISWVAGTTYVGNGTLGASDYVYFRPIGLTTTVAVNAGLVAHIPIAGADAYVGATYVNGLTKPYARKIVHRAWVELEALHSATSNDCEVIIAPIAGAGNTVSTTLTTGTTAGSTIADLDSVQNHCKVACYEDGKVDLSRFIRGGSGAQQNEFNNSGNTAATSVLGAATDQNGIVPCCFAIGGINNTLALRGANMHNVRVYEEVSLIDFVGAAGAADVVAYLTNEIELHQQRLLAHFAFMEKSRLVKPVDDPRKTATCRQLFDLRKRLGAAGLPIPLEASCESGCPGCAQRMKALGSQ